MFTVPLFCIFTTTFLFHRLQWPSILTLMSILSCFLWQLLIQLFHFFSCRSYFLVICSSTSFMHYVHNGYMTYLLLYQNSHLFNTHFGIVILKFILFILQQKFLWYFWHKTLMRIFPVSSVQISYRTRDMEMRS